MYILKNIKIFRNRPIIEWIFEIVKSSNLFDYIIVSTDNDEIISAPGGVGYSEPTLTSFKINGSAASDKNIARLTL